MRAALALLLRAQPGPLQQHPSPSVTQENESSDEVKGDLAESTGSSVTPPHCPGEAQSRSNSSLTCGSAAVAVPTKGIFVTALQDFLFPCEQHTSSAWSRVGAGRLRTGRTQIWNQLENPWHDPPHLGCI